jgi:hypothetical protein
MAKQESKKLGTLAALLSIVLVSLAVWYWVSGIHVRVINVRHELVDVTCESGNKGVSATAKLKPGSSLSFSFSDFFCSKQVSCHCRPQNGSVFDFSVYGKNVSRSRNTVWEIQKEHITRNAVFHSYIPASD